MGVCTGQDNACYESFDNEHKWNTRLFKANLRHLTYYAFQMSLF